MQYDARKEEKYIGSGCHSCMSDREEWQKELQRLCEGVYTDPDETKEVQVTKFECFKKTGNRHFADDGRGAELTIDLALQV